MLKVCPHTGEKFIPKRRNQVFASAKNRRDYHNKIMAELREAKGSIDKILQKNFVILNSIVKEPAKTYEFPLQTLTSKGFNPHAFTHMATYNGKSHRCLYDFILIYDGNKIHVTKQPRND